MDGSGLCCISLFDIEIWNEWKVTYIYIYIPHCIKTDQSHVESIINQHSLMTLSHTANRILPCSSKYILVCPSDFKVCSQQVPRIKQA